MKKTAFWEGFDTRLRLGLNKDQASYIGAAGGGVIGGVGGYTIGSALGEIGGAFAAMPIDLALTMLSKKHNAGKFMRASSKATGHELGVIGGLIGGGLGMATGSGLGYLLGDKPDKDAKKP